MKCERCETEVEYCYGDEPWSTDYLICPKCDSTYNTFEASIETVNKLKNEHHMDVEE
jgi:hypothetical protein